MKTYNQTLRKETNKQNIKDKTFGLFPKFLKTYNQIYRKKETRDNKHFAIKTIAFSLKYFVIIGSFFLMLYLIDDLSRNFFIEGGSINETALIYSYVFFILAGKFIIRKDNMKNDVAYIRSEESNTLFDFPGLLINTTTLKNEKDLMNIATAQIRSLDPAYFFQSIYVFFWLGLPIMFTGNILAYIILGVGALVDGLYYKISVNRANFESKKQLPLAGKYY